jgi:hypothetical protein
VRSIEKKSGRRREKRGKMEGGEEEGVWRKVSYGPPWAHYLGGYQDRLLGGPLGLPGLALHGT